MMPLSRQLFDPPPQRLLPLLFFVVTVVLSFVCQQQQQQVHYGVVGSTMSATTTITTKNLPSTVVLKRSILGISTLRGGSDSDGDGNDRTSSSSYGGGSSSSSSSSNNQEVPDMDQNTDQTLPMAVQQQQPPDLGMSTAVEPIPAVPFNPPVTTTASTTTSTFSAPMTTTTATGTAAAATTTNDGTVIASPAILTVVKNRMLRLYTTFVQHQKHWNIILPTPQHYTMISQYHSMIIAIVLAINSGYLNGLGLLGCLMIQPLSSETSSLSGSSSSSLLPPTPVAAVTGAYTNMALQLAQRKMGLATIPLRMIVSYLCGSLVCGYIIDTEDDNGVVVAPFEIKSSISMGTIFAIGTGCLLLASSMTTHGSYSRYIYYILTFVNGLQNSCTSIISNNQIRSTHYSGMTSDTGTFIGQYLRHSQKHPAQRNDLLLPKIYRNMILSLSFIIGSIISYIVSQGISTRYLLLPCITLYLTLTLVSLYGKPKTLPSSTTTTTTTTTPLVQLQ